MAAQVSLCAAAAVPISEGIVKTISCESKALKKAGLAALGLSVGTCTLLAKWYFGLASLDPRYLVPKALFNVLAIRTLLIQNQRTIVWVVSIVIALMEMWFSSDMSGRVAVAVTFPLAVIFLLAYKYVRGGELEICIFFAMKWKQW